MTLRFFRTFLLVLCLPSFFLFAAPSSLNGEFTVEPPPSWVQYEEAPLDATPTESTDFNCQCLIVDTQRNWEEQSLYSHFAYKIWTKNGVKDLSKIQFSFDPTFERLAVHHIRIFRDGEWFDRLQNARHHLLQRENRLENNIFTGRCTLFYILDDIRKGDIIDFAFSRIGELPLSSLCYSDCVSFQYKDSVKKRTHRFLAHPSHPCFIKTINTDIEPVITDRSPSLREWLWETMDTEPYTTEPNEPVWFNIEGMIEISQYTSWEEVVNLLLPLYQLPADFVQNIPNEMVDLVESWKEKAETPQEAALFALHFVQDEIRYFGFEEGINGLRPNHPCQTFQTRYGDCKDKTLLLHALLTLMDIPSKPALVHTEEGSRLSDMLPSFQLFNHAILQIEIDGATYWVDPTRSLQGGSLDTIYFPNYQWGLLIARDSTELVSIPKQVLKKPIEFDVLYTIESEDSAILSIKSMSHGYYADNNRKVLEALGIEKISKNVLSYVQKIHDGADIETPMEISDDPKTNTITTTHSYRIPIPKFSSPTTLNLYSYVDDYFYRNINSERTAPYEFDFPHWVKERIQIENPFFTWETAQETHTASHDTFCYHFESNIGENCAFFERELKYLDDYIAVDAISEYLDCLDEIDEIGSPRVTIISEPLDN